MAINEELRPSKRPAHAGSTWLLALLTLVAIGAALLASPTLDEGARDVEFLEDVLGAPHRTGPLAKSLPTGERFRIRDRALVAEADFGSVALEPLGLARGAEWTRSEHGVSRSTAFGSRTLVLDGTKAEEFLTVERRQGPRTWRWQLDTKLNPSLRVDGRVALVDPSTGGTFEIAPVRILDAAGDDVTPTGLQWALDGQRLELTLDDRELALPYVIDPAITVITPNGVNATTATATLSLAKPTGALTSGSTILVAHVSKRNADAVAATGWTSIGQTCNGTTVCTALLWKKFAGEAGPYSFTWTNAVGAAGGIVALANVWQPGTRSPVDSTVGATGTGTTANPGSLTNLFPTLGEMFVGGFAGQDSTPGIPTGKTDAGTAAITNGAQGNRIGARAATFNETSSPVSNWSSTLASAAWSARLAGFIPQATDGSGSLTTTTTDVAASSTGNTVAFTYTPTAGLDNGSVSVQVPAGWTAPQTGAGNGQITVSGGTGTNSITIAGTGPWTVRVDNVQIGDDGAGGIETLTITYNSGNAPAATGAQTWQAQSRGISTGTMTNLASSPSITVRAPNGSGTISSSVSNVANGATAQTTTFTYTATAGGMASGAVTVDVPAGWTAPNSMSGTAGYTTASTGTVSAAGQKITVSDVTLAAAATMTITYGSGAGGGASATTTAGPATWQVQQRAVTGGTLTTLGSSPSINVYDANNAGSISQTAGPTNVTRGAAIGAAITWTFTAGAGGMTGGSLGITVPSGWSAPRTTAGAGFTAVSAGTLGVSGQQIQVTGLALAAGATMTVTYGSGGGANLPVTGSTSGANTFSAVKHSTAGIGSAVATTSQPATINVHAADGSGTIGVSPTSAVAGSTGHTLTITYTAATGGIAAGAIELAVPAGWTAPQTASTTSAGYTTASGGSGTNAIAWNGGTRTLTISDVTLAAAASLTVTYGANAGSGGGGTAPTSTGAAATWTTQQKSTSGGTLTSVGASPSVTIAPAALSDFLVEASGGGAIGAQTAGSAFTIRATARDAYGNTVSSYNGAGDTVDITSSGALSSGGGTTGTFTNGVLALHSVTVTSSGSQTITATRTSGGAQSGTSTSFAVGAAAAATLDVAAPASVTAGVPFSVGVTARDAFNNVAIGYVGTVAFSGGGTGAQLPANYTFTAGDAGVKTFATVELRQAGSRTITVTDTVTGSITGGASITVGHGPAASLVVVPPATGTTGQAFSVTVTARDAYANTATGYLGTVTFSTTGGGASVPGNYTFVAGDSGSASLPGFSFATPGAKTVIATDTVTGSITGNGPITIGSAGASLANSTFGAAPATVVANGSSTSLITLQLKDALGANLTVSDGASYAFTTSGGSVGSATDNGDGTVSGTLTSSTSAGVATVSATRDGSPFANSVNVTFTPGPAKTLELSAPATATAGSTFSIVVTARDANGNVATGYTGTVAFSGGGAGAQLPANYTFVPGDAGTTTFASVELRQAGSRTITATDTVTGTITGSDTSTVDHGGAAQIALSGSVADLTSGANRVLTATIQDAWGNTVTSDSSTVVAFAKASGVGTVGGTGNATASSGVATKTISGQLVGSVTMEATAAGLTPGTVGDFTVVHGAAAQIALTGSIADLTSGATRVVAATIQDAAGNTVTSDNSTVIAFAKASGAGTVSGTGNATASGGIATKSITGALVGTVTLEATAAGLTTGALGAISVVHGAAAQIALTHSGSTASGDNHALTATIQDAAGNTVTTDNSTSVAYAKTGGAGTVTGLGSATASAGVATKVVVNAASGQIDLDAQSAGLTTGTAGYTIVAGSASTLTSTITASPTSIVANGSSTSAITVRLKDAAGNDLSDSGGIVGLGLTGTGSLSAVTDNGDGTYSATLTSPMLVGGATVSGTLNAVALAATAAVTYVPGPATQIVLTESGSNVAGNGHMLTATIADANGNTVTGDSSTVVAFAKTGGAGTVTGLGDATASNGIATTNVTNRLAGQIDLDAQAAGLATGTASYTITTGPVSAAASDSTVVAAPSTVYANGSNAATITVTLRDAGGNAIPGKTVTLAQGSGGSSISGGGSTNAFGVVTFSATNTAVETVTYTATDTTDAITVTDDTTVDFIFADGTTPTNSITLGSATRAWLSGTTLYYNGAAGGSFTLSSAVADGGSGPASASYPAVTQPGWTHGAETVSTPSGGPYVSSAFAFAAGSTGNFTHDVTASDAWTPPNTAVTTLNVTEDSTAPAVSVLCNGGGCSAGWYTASPVSVTLAAPDAGAGLDQIRYTTDGTDPTILTGNVYAGAFTVAAEGVTTVKYRTFDRIGNDTGVLAQTLWIDTVAPDTAIDSAPGAATQDTTPTFAFSASEAGTTFQARVDGGAWAAEASPLTLAPLAEDTYTFEVRAIDAAGNVDGTPASFTFTVDVTPANTTITSSPPAASNSTGASFSFTASDAGPGFECQLDGGAFATCTSPQSYSGLTEAAHSFEVRAKDAAGNVDATAATHAWTVDLTAPNTSFGSTPSNPSPNATPTFGLNSTETPATFECDLDGGGWSSCSTPFTTPALGDGSHTLKARATDAAGNTDATAVTFTWLVDATAPTGSITAPANGAAVGGTYVLASDSADAGSGLANVVFQRSPAGAGTWTSQVTNWDTTAQTDGDYDLRVVTTDGAGNAFTSPVITVTVDNADPSLSVVAPNPVNLAIADPATVSATASDAGSGIANVRFDQCAEDSPACTADSWVLLGIDTGAPYAASWPIPADGPRLLRVRATDNAGKQRTEFVLTTIDRTRPTGSLTAPAGGANLRGAGVALAATASDTSPGAVNTVTFQRSPAGADTWTDVTTDSLAPYTGTLDTTGLSDGLYDLRVFTTDAAGNAEAAPGTIQVRVDNTVPTGSVTAPVAAANVRGTIALASDSADTGSGVATVQFQRSPAGAGSWTNQAASFDTTTDNAGNAFTSAEVTIRVDNTLPTGSLTAPAAAANVRGTIALASDSADTGSGVATVQFQRSPAGAGSWTNQAASFDTTTVADGQYDLRVTTTDNAGNAFTSAAITIRVDNTLPTGSLTAPANSAEIGVSPVALSSDSADAGGSGVAAVAFERSPAGAGTWTTTAASWNTMSGPDAVADGTYDLRVRTADNAGNVFTSPAITVLVDHTAPTTSASLAPGTPSNAPVTVSFSASDGAGSGVSAVSYRVDGGGPQLGSAVIVLAPGDHSNDGSHLVEFFATDEVGNVETLKSVTVVIDTTAPSGSGADPGTYLRGIANLTYSTTAGDVSSVQFQFSPAGAGAWSNVGGADISPPYEAAWNTALVADGPYDLRVVVTDTTGNVATTLLPGLPKTVDNTAPAGSVIAPAGGVYVSGAIAVDANATDGAAPPASGVAVVRFEVKPAGAGAYSVFGTQTAPVSGSTFRQTLATTALTDGLVELRVVVTDVAGNEATSALSTINVDNDAPVVTLADPGTAVSAIGNLTATSSADTTDVTFRYRPVGSGGAGTAIASDSTAPFAVTWTTTPAAEQQWELIAVATDGGGNATTSTPRTVLVDRTQPTGSVTAPVAGTSVGGPAVALTATAADMPGSGVTLVEWQVKEFGAGSFTTVASDATAPYAGTWDSTSALDGAAEIRALVTDAAGNVRTAAVVPVTVDSTGPGVTLADPGPVLSGTVSLAATTGGGAIRVQFSVSPANAGTWTQIAEDTTAPFASPFDTATLADGLYDLRAIGFDGLGNASAASIRGNVRLDNTAPQLVSATPADGSISTSASQIVLTASEPVTAPGALLDGAAAPVPVAAGNQLTFPTGSLADGLHVLSGELEDASGTRVPFRVAVTIESAVGADRPPVERSARPGGPSTLVGAGSLAAVTLPATAWPAPPSPTDFVVLRVDLAPPAPVLGAGLLAGTQLVEVTARWALAGTPVTSFAAPIEIVIPNPSGEPTLPATSQDGTTWRALELLRSATLPSGQQDGWYRDDAGIHILTRHLTWYALARDGEAPTAPRDLAGVLADDGLTLRWIPGTDSSGQIGNVLLYVNGEPYRWFGPTEFEAKLGAFVAGDTRSFTLAQKDAAGNLSAQTAPLRAVPVLAGKSLQEAAAALGAAGFTIGNVTEAVAAAPAGVVVEPATTRFALATSPVDLVVSLGTAAPQTRLVFSVTGAKRIALKKKTTIAVRIKVSKPARVTATLRNAKSRRLHTWRLRVRAGANVIRLRLPATVRRSGSYRLTWVARAGTETVSRTVRLTIVAGR